jgi:hypothetical protein
VTRTCNKSARRELGCFFSNYKIKFFILQPKFICNGLSNVSITFKSSNVQIMRLIKTQLGCLKCHS